MAWMSQDKQNKEDEPCNRPRYEEGRGNLSAQLHSFLFPIGHGLLQGELTLLCLKSPHAILLAAIWEARLNALCLFFPPKSLFI